MAKSFSSICFYCQSRFCCGIVFLFGKRDAGKNLVTVTKETFGCGNEGSACCEKNLEQARDENESAVPKIVLF